MGLEEKIKALETIKFKIKQIVFKIKELKSTYLPSHETSVFTSHSSGGTSPQERIVAKIDSLERELASLQNEAFEINEDIYQILDTIKDPKAKWIVTQKIKGKAWQEIECNNLSISHMKHIYKQTIDALNGEKNA